MSTNYKETPKTTWKDLLNEVITEEGVISEAFKAFHNYSVGNQIMAWTQCKQRGIQPSPIATMRNWNRMGRKVKKGETGLWLWNLFNKTYKCPDCGGAGCPECDNTGKKHFYKFALKRWWFALEQTEPIDGKEQKWQENLPTFLTDNIVQRVSKLDIDVVPFEFVDGNTMGYAQEDRVAVSDLCQHPFHTIVHEIAHVLLGHTGQDNTMKDSAILTPNQKELEAECVAYIVSHVMDVEKDAQAESRGYVQAWWKEQQVPEESARKIFSTAQKILNVFKAE